MCFVKCFSIRDSQVIIIIYCDVQRIKSCTIREMRGYIFKNLVYNVVHLMNKERTIKLKYVYTLIVKQLYFKKKYVYFKKSCRLH